jgi:hypothetical protein
MSRMRDRAFGLYVEKEYVGKRVKGSKVKVTWKVACLPELKTTEVELKHSLVFGKREVKLDGQLIVHKKSMLNGDFTHDFVVASGHRLTVSIRDDFEGYVYDLTVDDCPFHKLTRISMDTLEELRRAQSGKALTPQRAAPPPPLPGEEVQTLSYAEFVRPSGRASTPGKLGTPMGPVRAPGSVPTAMAAPAGTPGRGPASAGKPGKSSPPAAKDDSDTDEEDAGEDMWITYERNRKAAAVQQQQRVAAARAGASAGWGGPDPFLTYGVAPPPPAQQGQQQQDAQVSKLSKGLEGVDFSSPTYATPHGASTNPFNTPAPAYEGASSDYFAAAPAAYGVTPPPAFGAPAYAGLPSYGQPPPPFGAAAADAYGSNPFGAPAPPQDELLWSPTLPPQPDLSAYYQQQPSYDAAAAPPRALLPVPPALGIPSAAQPSSPPLFSPPPPPMPQQGMLQQPPRYGLSPAPAYGSPPLGAYGQLPPAAAYGAPPRTAAGSFSPPPPMPMPGAYGAQYPSARQ